MNPSLTIVSCLYGDTYRRFVPAWEQSIADLTTRPTDIVVATDRANHIPSAHVYVSDCTWKHPQAFYLQQAISLALTEWVWILDIDDTAMPDAIDGFEDVAADVWQLGYQRSDGETYIPPQLTGDELLASDRCVFVGGSMIRVDAFRECGGFPDVAYQDWALWRRLARAEATFQSSGRAHFRYTMHPARRGETELAFEWRPALLAEMYASEGFVVA